jgi:FG-GAP repeat
MRVWMVHWHGFRHRGTGLFAIVDVDGDGVKDIVRGKRFWSHGRAGDPDRTMPIYWFKLVRHAGKRVHFIPYLIDKESGVGTQVLSGDINGDGLPDIVVRQQTWHLCPPAREEDHLARRVGESAAETSIVEARARSFRPYSSYKSQRRKFQCPFRYTPGHIARKGTA